MYLLLVLLVLFRMNDNNYSQYHRSSKEVQGHIWISIAQRNIALSKEIAEDGNFNKPECRNILVTCLSDLQKNMEQAQACFRIGGVEAQSFGTTYAREQVHNVSEALQSRNLLECTNLLDNNPNITKDMVESLSEAIGTKFDYMSSEDGYRQPLIQVATRTITNFDSAISTNAAIGDGEDVNTAPTTDILGGSDGSRDTSNIRIENRIVRCNVEESNADESSANLLESNPQNLENHQNLDCEMVDVQHIDTPTTSNHINSTTSVNNNAVNNNEINNEDHTNEEIGIPAVPPTEAPAPTPTDAPIDNPNDMRYMQPYKQGYLRYVPSDHNRPDVIA